jgi:hypothetical protein
MTLAQRFPRTYRHRGYVVEAIALQVCGCNGWLRWSISPPDGPVFWASTLAEARQLIEADRLGWPQELAGA